MKADWRTTLCREVAAARRLVVLGVGAREKGDDAAGHLCAISLRRELRGRHRGRVKVLAAADVPESATGPIRRFRPALVLIVDAALADRRPGAVFFVPREALAEESPTTHAVPLRYLAAYLEETAGCRVIVLGIQPGRIAPGEPLSAPVRAAAQAVVREILGGLKAGRGAARP